MKGTEEATTTRYRSTDRWQELPQLGEHRGGIFEDVAVRKAAELVAPGMGLALAAAVLLPGVAGAMESLGVELDGELVVRPAAVDIVRARGLVRDRQRQALLAQQGAEAALELTEQDGRVTFEDGQEALRGALNPR